MISIAGIHFAYISCCYVGQTLDKLCGVKNNLLLTEYAWNLNTLRKSPITSVCFVSNSLSVFLPFSLISCYQTSFPSCFTLGLTRFIPLSYNSSPSFPQCNLQGKHRALSSPATGSEVITVTWCEQDAAYYRVRTERVSLVPFFIAHCSATSQQHCNFGC